MPAEIDISLVLSCIHSLPPPRKEELGRKFTAGELTEAEKEEFSGHILEAMVRLEHEMIVGRGVIEIFTEWTARLEAHARQTGCHTCGPAAASEPAVAAASIAGVQAGQNSRPPSDPKQELAMMHTHTPRPLNPNLATQLVGALVTNPQPGVTGIDEAFIRQDPLPLAALCTLILECRRLMEHYKQLAETQEWAAVLESGKEAEHLAKSAESVKRAKQFIGLVIGLNDELGKRAV